MASRPLLRPTAASEEAVRRGQAPPRRSDPLRDAARFTDPLTRMLLAGNGFTTPVLEALLGRRLEVRVLRQDLVPAADISGDVAALLRLDPSRDVLVRNSSLVDSDLSPVSLNQVIAAPADGRLHGDITSLDTPIGHSLLGGDRHQHREIVHIGRSNWWHDGRSEPCAVKAYIMVMDDRPWCYIRECFNPVHVPSTVTTTTADPSAEPRDHVVTLHRDDRACGPAPFVSTLTTAGPDAERLDACVTRLRALPPLVNPSECRTLTSRLAGTVTGDAIALHMGGRAEGFAGCTPSRIQARQALITVGAAIVGFGTGLPAVALGPIAGEHGTPCTRLTEPEPGAPRIGMPSGVRDVADGNEPTADVRTADPQGLLDAYFHASATLNYLRSHPAPSPEAIAEITTAARETLRHGSWTTTDLIYEIDHLLTTALAAPARSRCLHSLVPTIYTAREALSLPYEQALTRCTADGACWDASAHLLWIGDGTRDPRQAHVRFAAQVRNPIAVRLGPSARPEDVAALCSLLNPGKVLGRLTFITGLGAARVHDLLPPLLEAADGVPVTWMCDPTHGQTTGKGRPVRCLEDIIEEIRAFFAVHRDHGTVPGGIHLETAGEVATESTAGWPRARAAGRSDDHQTLRGPRLSPAQALECVVATVRELRRQAMSREPATGQGTAPITPDGRS